MKSTIRRIALAIVLTVVCVLPARADFQAGVSVPGPGLRDRVPNLAASCADGEC